MQNKKEKEKLISIIVPVYNTSKYVYKCLESIKDAITDDCEVLVINDGSTDNSEDIIKDFIKELPAKNKNQFKLYTKENGGLADTKNYGIEHSTGKFLSFIDSDDYISKDFYRVAIPYLDKYDVIIYDLYAIFENKNEDIFNYVSRAYNDKFDLLEDCVLNGEMQGSSCNKIIKRELYKYKFPKGKQYEDVAVTPFILIDANKIKYLPYAMYYYLQRNTSIVGTNTLYDAFYKICNNINDVLENDEKKMKKYEKVIDLFYISRCIENLELNIKKDKKNVKNNLKEFYEHSKNTINYIIKSNLIERSNYNLTSNQKKMISKFYKELIEEKYNEAAKLFELRNKVNYIRTIGNSGKSFLKSFIGG